MPPRLPCSPPRRRGTLLVDLLWPLAVFLAASSWMLCRSADGAGLVTVGDSEVAVVEHLWGGTSEEVLQPGFQLEVPYLRAVHRFDRRPVEYVMEGSERVDADHVPRLVVRTPDGSSYWFGRVTVQYAIDPQRLDAVLRDAGAGDRFREGLVDLHARAILRDELGRHTAEEIVAADTRTAAVRRARERLAERLARHGLLVLEVGVSQPSFARDYETTLQRREVAERETEALELEVRGLEEGRERELAQLRGKQEIGALELEAELARRLEKAQRQAVVQRAAALRERDARILEGELARDQKQAQAEALRARAREEAGSFRAQVAAVASQGRAAVRSALIESLGKVQIQVVPTPGEADGEQGGRR